MVALEASSPAPPPLSPTQSAFLAAYVDARCDVRITARKLQIPLEAANAQFADPALQAHLAILDESEKRSARQAAIEAIHQAMAGLNRAMEYKGDPAMSAKASGHLARAALWLVRIAEGKVGPDALPRRYRRDDPDRPPEPPRPDRPRREPISEADQLNETLKTIARLRAGAPEMFTSRVGSQARPQSTALPVHTASTSSAAERRQYVAPGGSPGFATTSEHTEPRRGDTSNHTASPAPASFLARANMQPDREGGRCAPPPPQQRAAPIGAQDVRSSTGHGSVQSEAESRAATPRTNHPAGTPASLLTRAGTTDSS